MVSKYIAAAAALVTVVAAHGNITSPPARIPGPAMAAACGQAAADSAIADGTTPLEDIDMSGATAACQLDLCRGATFSDNTANVQTYTVGQTIRMLAQLPIRHEGPMNVSIVDTSTNTVIGNPLIEFASYADENLAQLPPNNTDFSVTMPQLADGQCAQPGQCTLQWFWFGTKAKQTYESCVDFVMASAVDGTAAASSAPAGSTAAPVASTAASVASTAPAAPAVSASAASSGGTSAYSFVYRARRFRA